MEGKRMTWQETYEDFMSYIEVWGKNPYRFYTDRKLTYKTIRNDKPSRNKKKISKSKKRNK